MAQARESSAPYTRKPNGGWTPRLEPLDPKNCAQQIQQGDTAIIMALLQAGHPADSLVSDQGVPALAIALANHDRSLCNMLLARGADPNLHRPGSSSYLHQLLRHLRASCQLQDEIEDGESSDPSDIQDLPQESALLLFLLDDFLSHQADPSYLDSDSGLAPLHLAIDLDLPSAAQKLLSARANPNQLDASGRSPLHHALLSSGKAFMFLPMLLKHGADMTGSSGVSESPRLMLERLSASLPDEVSRHLLSMLSSS